MRILIIFFLQIFQMIFGAMLHSLFPRWVKYYRSNLNNLSKIDRVEHLEKRRQYKGYKKQWLYYRCKEEDLLDEYYKLFPDGQSIDQVNKATSYGKFMRFSFGKYSGETIDTIWKKDRQYIEWLSNQDWLSEYQEESEYIMDLIDPNRFDG